MIMAIASNRGARHDLRHMTDKVKSSRAIQVEQQIGNIEKEATNQTREG